MGNGILEREQALKVKRIVSQTKSKRRQRQFQHSPQHLRPDLETPPVVKEVSVSLPPTGPNERTIEMQSATAPQDQLQLGVSEGNVNPHSQPMWRDSISNAILPVDYFFNQDGGIPTPSQRQSDATTIIGNEDTESNSASPEHSMVGSAFTSYSPSVCEDNGRGGVEAYTDVPFETNVRTLVASAKQKFNASYRGSHSTKKPTSNNQACPSSPLQMNWSPTSPPLGRYNSWLAGVDDPILCRDIDDSLFMYYLDQVFYVQYPFYRSSNQHRRGWLFSILRRVKSAYHAALALSEYHQQSKFPQQIKNSSSTSCPRAKGRHYDLALQEMQLNLSQSHTWNGTQSLIRNVETLTCILQLLFWEVCFLSLSYSLQY